MRQRPPRCRTPAPGLLAYRRVVCLAVSADARFRRPRRPPRIVLVVSRGPCVQVRRLLDSRRGGPLPPEGDTLVDRSRARRGFHWAYAGGGCATELGGGVPRQCR